MSKVPHSIKTLDDLRARKYQLKQEIVTSQREAKNSIQPAQRKLGAFVFSKVAPVAAVGAGLYLVTKLVGGSGAKKAQDAQTSDAHLALLEADRRRERAEGRRVEQAATATSPSFVALIRGLLPFVKVIFPLLQSLFATHQAAKATDIAKDAQEAATAVHSE